MNIAAKSPALLAAALLAASPAGAVEERLDPGAAPAEEHATTPAQDAAGEPDADGTAIPGEILVKFEKGVGPDEIDAINRRLGATVVNTMMGGRLVLVSTPYPGVTSDLIAAYSATEGVEYAEPNREVSLYPPPEMDEPREDAPAPPSGSRGQGGGLPPPNEDGSSPLVPLPGPR